MGRRILVVDDHVSTADTLKMFFELDGYEVAAAYNGLEAIELVSGFGPDIVIMDINMPLMNGMDAARSIKEQNPGTNIKFIAVTGLDQSDDRVNILEAGFEHHLVKPVDPNQLRELLTSLTTEAA